MNEDYSKKAEWNIDDEILILIKSLIVSFFRDLKIWRLDDAYWTLNLIWMQIDAKLTKAERRELENDMRNLEKIRRNYINLNNKEEKGKFLYEMRKFYIKANRLAKEHNLWFREKEDEGL